MALDTLGTNPIIARKFGRPFEKIEHLPDQLFGKERLVSVKKNVHLTLNINIFGNGAGGIGIDTAKEVLLTSRWVFNGRLKPAAHPTQKGRHTAVYRTLEWELTESDFELHMAHTNIIYTGFAFEDDDEPFYMEVNVKGKLKSTKDNFLRYMKFFSNQGKSKGSASTFVHLPRGCRDSTHLDSLADSLPRQMEMENLEAVPTEVPDALPGSVHMGGIAKGPQ
ncbi:hypothetical protein EYC80_006557 [Monilinia laxa]|uniref:Uncharacterized protein n=1 Tax=Monilinia laxa TaxID=61186 RepID=A0A5N6JS99_MONLA|nr:hypothetical protein EYC80_006557 [Monilinia laxa]